jgi:murein DD-endopeptidase MepM/ murein hydrolase activator NlpD
LYAPIGTTVHAITDGTVVRGPEPFYAGTFAIEIDHGTFLARYGEVQGTALIRKGDTVTAGQPIAKVGRLVGIVVPSAMLHLELYDKSAHGPLTVGAAEGKISNGRPFMRRKDLIDPTPKLNEWRNNLP